MLPLKKIYECQACGFASPKWLGKCPQCDSWNSFEAVQVEKQKKVNKEEEVFEKLIPITECITKEQQNYKIPTRLSEFDRVVGGGIIKGGVILIGGEPGIGKSTLALQLAGLWALHCGTVLYIHGEESFHQVQERAKRLGVLNEYLLMFSSTNLMDILTAMDMKNISLVIVDSIQSINNADLGNLAGSISQIRECTYALVQKAKEKSLPVIIIGHITKEGLIAGPKVLEHVVDTVLYFEGEGKLPIRLLRAVKNRFGSTQEIGVFEMTSQGLREVNNPGMLFLQERPVGVSGSLVMPVMGGTRPLLVEIQALVGHSKNPQPRRGVVGLNSHRVSLLLAVLEKRTGIYLSDRDVYVNVAGGIFVEEPATDLAVVIALLSSFYNIPVNPQWTAFGEVGLAGEVRKVNGLGTRLNEVNKFGFKTCIIPYYEEHEYQDFLKEIEIVKIKNIGEIPTLIGVPED